MCAGTSLLISAVLFMQSSSFQNLLCAQVMHISGTVSDLGGNPIPNASIDHSADPRHPHQTDASGKFELDTRAPSLVIRKPGFRSELVRTQDANPVRIVLRTSDEKRALPVCPAGGSLVGIDNWEASFHFVRVPGVYTSRQVRDIDYGSRDYYVKTKTGRKGIRHGSGPMWTLGLPSDKDVWRSVKYDEARYDFGELPIIDARGEWSDGHRWRYLGKFFESASYSDVDEATAKVLDKFLDGVCTTHLSIK